MIFIASWRSFSIHSAMISRQWFSPRNKGEDWEVRFFSDDSPILEAMRMVVDFLKLRLGWRFFLILPRSDLAQQKIPFQIAPV